MKNNTTIERSFDCLIDKASSEKEMHLFLEHVVREENEKTIRKLIRRELKRQDEYTPGPAGGIQALLADSYSKIRAKMKQ